MRQYPGSLMLNEAGPEFTGMARPTISKDIPELHPGMGLPGELVCKPGGGQRRLEEGPAKARTGPRGRTKAGVKITKAEIKQPKLRPRTTNRAWNCPVASGNQIEIDTYDDLLRWARKFLLGRTLEGDGQAA